MAENIFNNNTLNNFPNYPINQHTHTCPFHHPNYSTAIVLAASENKYPSKKHKTSSPPKNNNDDNVSRPKVFQCQFCPRNFNSYKALGGHQNAHKRERAAARAVAATATPVVYSVLPLMTVLGNNGYGCDNSGFLMGFDKGGASDVSSNNYYDNNNNYSTPDLNLELTLGSF